jgi:hypothetical protein
LIKLPPKALPKTVSETPSPKTPVSFEAAIRDFADRIELPNPERLVEFVRKIVNGVLSHLKLSPSKRVAADQAGYLLGVANRLGSDYELAVLPADKISVVPKRKNGRLITLGFKVSDYKGPSDIAMKSLEAGRLPAMVDRKQVVANEVMVGSNKVWIGTKRLQKVVAHGHKSFFVLDVETVPKSKKPEQSAPSPEPPMVAPQREPTIISPEAVTAETAPSPEGSPAGSEASPADPLPSPSR